jgi:hypothetical protein
MSDRELQGVLAAMGAVTEEQWENGGQHNSNLIYMEMERREQAWIDEQQALEAESAGELKYWNNPGKLTKERPARPPSHAFADEAGWPEILRPGIKAQGTLGMQYSLAEEAQRKAKALAESKMTDDEARALRRGAPSPSKGGPAVGGRPRSLGGKAPPATGRVTLVMPAKELRVRLYAIGGSLSNLDDVSIVAAKDLVEHGRLVRAIREREAGGYMRNGPGRDELIEVGDQLEREQKALASIKKPNAAEKRRHAAVCKELLAIDAMLADEPEDYYSNSAFDELNPHMKQFQRGYCKLCWEPQTSHRVTKSGELVCPKDVVAKSDEIDVHGERLRGKYSTNGPLTTATIRKMSDDELRDATFRYIDAATNVTNMLRDSHGRVGGATRERLAQLEKVEQLLLEEVGRRDMML